MKSRVAAWLMALLLLVYFALLGWRAVQFIFTGDVVGILIGIALIVLPLVGAWALWRELAFGFGTERLVKRLAAEGGLPEEELALSPSGRPDRVAAAADFARFQEAVEAEPESWRAWFRLGLAYDAARDRRRARGAIVHALKLERAASRADRAADGAR